MAMMLIDQTKDSACKTAEADAIRAKMGGSAQLAYDWANNKGFADAIAAIPSGGGGPTLQEYLKNELTDYVDDTLTSIPNFAFNRYSGGIKNFRAKNATSVGQTAFYLINSLESFFAPLAAVNAQTFYGCWKMSICVCSAFAGNIATNADVFMKYGTDPSLHTVDFSLKKNGFGKRMFQNCVNLKTLILREAAIFPLGDVSAFTGTPFASDGTGGTIYIPKSMYDHLGDNSADDYKAATNWSTVNGYGTITWAIIEGSVYENAYADGTPIS